MFNLPKELNTSFKGQATLLAVLIATAVAVVTAVGVTTRQNSSFRRTTYTTQTDQSFSCANSGVDAALLCITEQEKIPGSDPVSISNTCKKSTSVSLADGNCSYTSEISNLITGFTINPITQGQVQQLNTSNATGITLNWADGDSNTQFPALEVTYAYLNGSNNYEMKKYAYTCNGTPSGVHGFDNINGTCEVTINFTASSESIVRIKPLFSSASVKVDIIGANNSQGFKILSHGKAGNAVRNIEVLRMNPQLPALFDYVLYSEEGDIKK